MLRFLRTPQPCCYGILQPLLLLVGAGLLLAQPALASNEVSSRILQICIANQGYPPYTYENAEGRFQHLVREAMTAQGWQVEFVAKPWRRCVLEVQQGRVQAIGPVFPTPEHLQRMVFPQVNGVSDVRRSLGIAKMVLLRTAGSPVTWDEKAFSGLSGPLLYQSGVSALTLMLSSMPLAAADAAPRAQTLARMLLKGRSNAAIIHEYDALELLKLAEFQGQFEIEPFQSGAVYLGFSRQFYQQHPQDAEQVWAHIGQRRAALRKQDSRGPGSHDVIAVTNHTSGASPGVMEHDRKSLHLPHYSTRRP
jgi:polar amino acid transport system substrate-binding protein